MLGGLALGASIGGGLLSMFGGQSAAQAQASAAKSAALLEAEYLEQQAFLTETAGEYESFTTERSLYEQFGKQVNAFARNGVDLSGSALRELTISKSKIEQELAVIGFNTKAKADLIRMRANATRAGAANIGSGGGLLSTIGGLLNVGAGAINTGANLGMFNGTGTTGLADSPLSAGTSAGASYRYGGQ